MKMLRFEKHLSPTHGESRGSVRFISLGCPRNLVDTEIMVGKLLQAGYHLVTDDNDPAHILVINTCCFIKEAKAESEEVMRQAIALKQLGKYHRIIVTGCLVQQEGESLRRKYQNKIDAWLGVFNREAIVEACENQSKSSLVLGEPPQKARVDLERFLVTPRHYAYLRIAEGCNHFCTFCIIPQLHGSYRSKPWQAVLKEANWLANQGVKELNLIAQETTAYGSDLPDKISLSDLLEALSQIPQITWIRLLYTHPKHFTYKLIKTISQNDKVVKYIDLPIQHISDHILERMGRGVSSTEIKNLIERLRTTIPGLFLRTSIIVGFPGETEQDFNELLNFLKEVRFERLGAFKYSRMMGTPAANYQKQIPEKVKTQRWNAVMKQQQQIAFEINNALIGKCLPVIIDKRDNRQSHQYLGRTYGDAAEVDGNILIRGSGLRIGEIYQVRVTGYQEYDLRGVVV